MACIFASDLDQTLIYSQTALERIACGSTEGAASREQPAGEESAKALRATHRIVEYYENKPLSYMSKRLCTLFAELFESKQLIFVPMTTRTLKAYQRIQFPYRVVSNHSGYVPAWAITTNGGVVLHHGDPDPRWTAQLSAKLKNESTSIDEVEKKFQSDYAGSWVLRTKRAEERFSYSIVERENVPHDTIEKFRRWLEARGWSLSLQGRKLYFVPNAVSKAEALKYVRTAIEHEAGAPMPLIASGDSLLDLPALEMADIGIVPKHGEIFSCRSTASFQSNIQFTTESGMAAAEEILDNVLNRTIYK